VKSRAKVYSVVFLKENSPGTGKSHNGRRWWSKWLCTCVWLVFGRGRLQCVAGTARRRLFTEERSSTCHVLTSTRGPLLPSFYSSSRVTSATNNRRSCLRCCCCCCWWWWCWCRFADATSKNDCLDPRRGTAPRLRAILQILPFLFSSLPDCWQRQCVQFYLFRLPVCDGHGQVLWTKLSVECYRQL